MGRQQDKQLREHVMREELGRLRMTVANLTKALQKREAMLRIYQKAATDAAAAFSRMNDDDPASGHLWVPRVDPKAAGLELNLHVEVSPVWSYLRIQARPAPQQEEREQQRAELTMNLNEPPKRKGPPLIVVPR